MDKIEFQKKYSEIRSRDIPDENTLFVTNSIFDMSFERFKQLVLTFIHEEGQRPYDVFMNEKCMIALRGWLKEYELNKYEIPNPAPPTLQILMDKDKKPHATVADINIFLVTCIEDDHVAMTKSFCGDFLKVYKIVNMSPYG